MAEDDDNKTRGDTEEKTVREREVDTTGMKPWEQHSAIIIIPRYDYKAPSSIPEHSHSGFLITCPIKREKSATKEAISIFEKFFGSSKNAIPECARSSDENGTTKKRKLSIEEDNNVLERKSSTTDFEEDGKPSEASSSIENGEKEGSPVLSLVKLTRSGLLLFTFPKEYSSFPDTVTIVSNIIQSLESRNLKAPLWCHRIFPFQATCILNEKYLHALVAKLVFQFISDERNILSQPVKFAVGYNRRGIEETEIKKTSKHNSMDTASLHEMLDKTKCFSVVASAVKSVIPNAVVDLKNPEVSILVELLPLSSVSNGSLVAAVSVLPQNLVCVKPKLGIKTLISDTKSTSVKN